MVSVTSAGVCSPTSTGTSTCSGLSRLDIGGRLLARPGRVRLRPGQPGRGVRDPGQIGGPGPGIELLEKRIVQRLVPERGDLAGPVVLVAEDDGFGGAGGLTG